jgi:hypothetical protein
METGNFFKVVLQECKLCNGEISDTSQKSDTFTRVNGLDGFNAPSRFRTGFEEQRKDIGNSSPAIGTGFIF